MPATCFQLNDSALFQNLLIECKVCLIIRRIHEDLVNSIHFYILKPKAQFICLDSLRGMFLKC